MKTPESKIKTVKSKTRKKSEIISNSKTNLKTVNLEPKKRVLKKNTSKTKTEIPKSKKITEINKKDVGIKKPSPKSKNNNSIPEVTTITTTTKKQKKNKAAVIFFHKNVRGCNS
jgi:hypothetical protein